MKRNKSIAMLVLLHLCLTGSMCLASEGTSPAGGKFFRLVIQQTEDECGSCEDDDSCPPDGPPE